MATLETDVPLAAAFATSVATYTAQRTALKSAVAALVAQLNSTIQPPPPVTHDPSPDKTSIPPANTIWDAAGHAWTIVAGVATRDGTPDTSTSHVNMMLWWSGSLYYMTDTGSWRILIAFGNWAPTTDPRIVPLSPAPAAAVGYNLQTFGSTIALGTDLRKFTFFGTDPTGITANQSGGSSGPIVITGGGNNYGAQLCTASYDPTASAAHRYMSGTAFGGGGYFEVTLAMQTTPPSTAGASFWANDIESMAGGSFGDQTLRQWPGQAANYGDWIEIAGTEFNTGTTTSYGLGIHNFYGSGTASNPSVPAPASAAGFNTQTFGPAITLGSDPTLTTLNGNVQKFNFFGCSWTTIGVNQNGDGSISIVGNTGNNYGAELCSAAYHPGPSPYIKGVAFGGGGYFEATISMVNQPSAAGASFWFNDIESMAGGSFGDLTLRQWPGQAVGYGNWIELDAPEFNTGNTTQFGHGIHNFYGGGTNLDTGTYPGFVSPVTAPGGTDFRQPHQYGVLWVPATDSTQGFITWYFDRVQIGQTVFWNKWSAGMTPPPVQGTTAYSVIDTRHLAFILGNGDANNLVTVHSVEVWQATAAHNIGAALGTTLAGVPIPSGWEMKRVDTFGTSGSVPDLTTLHSLYAEGQFYNVSGDRVWIPNTVINSEQQTYSHFEDVIAFSTDHLTIQGRGHVGNTITSGEMVSKWYGRSFIFEVRAKAPISSGSWTAIWAYARAAGGDGSELDVEMTMVIGDEAANRHRVYHYNHPGQSNVVISDSNFTTPFMMYQNASFNVDAAHTYTIVYDDVAGKVSRYIDGTLIYSADFKWNASLGGTGHGPDAILTICLAAGGSWPGQIATPSAYSGDLDVYSAAYYAPTAWTPPPPVVTPQTWGALRGSHVSLSGSDLIATAAAGGGVVYGALFNTTGKFYWEVILNNSGNVGAGIGSNQVPVGDAEWVGGSNNSIGWYNAGAVYNGGSLKATFASFGNGAIRLCFSIDLTSATKKLWGRVGATGNWDNDVLANQNPATGAGGIDLSTCGDTLSWPVTAGASLSAGDTATGCFTSASWVGTAPSGFTAFVTS
jgi:hypothetical protein